MYLECRGILGESVIGQIFLLGKLVSFLMCKFVKLE